MDIQRCSEMVKYIQNVTDDDEQSEISGNGEGCPETVRNGHELSRMS